METSRIEHELEGLDKTREQEGDSDLTQRVKLFCPDTGNNLYRTEFEQKFDASLIYDESGFSSGAGV